MIGFWDAVASAGPYAKNLHLAPDRKPHQHLITQFLQAGCSSWCPTNSVKALKVIRKTGRINQICMSAGCMNTVKKQQGENNTVLSSGQESCTRQRLLVADSS